MTSTTALKVGAAYIRVSTDGQMDLSPESQLESIVQYAKSSRIVIPKEYIFMESEGRSGKKADNRPEFQRMIATAKTTPKPLTVSWSGNFPDLPGIRMKAPSTRECCGKSWASM